MKDLWLQSSLVSAVSIFGSDDDGCDDDGDVNLRKTLQMLSCANLLFFPTGDTRGLLMDGWVDRDTDGRRYVPRAGDGRTGG